MGHDNKEIAREMVHNTRNILKDYGKRRMRSTLIKTNPHRDPGPPARHFTLAYKHRVDESVVFPMMFSQESLLGESVLFQHTRGGFVVREDLVVREDMGGDPDMFPLFEGVIAKRGAISRQVRSGLTPSPDNSLAAGR